MKNLLFFILFCQFIYCQEAPDKDKYRNSGYFNLTRFSYISADNVKQDIFVPGEGSFSYDLDSSESKAHSLQTINGYFFSPYFSAGLGLGLDGYRKPTLNTLPVFLDVRAYLNDDFNSLFIFVDYGTLVKINDNFNKGNLFNIGAGYKVALSKERRIILMPEIGYSVKNISLTDESVRTSNNAINITGILFSVGVIF